MPISKIELSQKISRQTASWGPFLVGPEKFPHPESRSKISNLMITKLFYSHIVNIKRGPLHARSSRRIQLSVRVGFAKPKCFPVFWEMCPRSP